MMNDNDTLKRLLRINDGLFQLCKWLTDKGDIETSSRLIPFVDELSHILTEAGRISYSDAAVQGLLYRSGR